MANKPFKKLRFSLTGDTYSPVDEQARRDIGDLSQLDTTHKDNLVEAINEAARSGGGGTGVPSGGTKGQVLTKLSSVEGDAGWEYPPIMTASGNDTSSLAVSWNENFTAFDFFSRQEILQAVYVGSGVHLKLVKAYITATYPDDVNEYHFEFGAITAISNGIATIATLEVVCDSPSAHSGVGVYSEVSVGVSDEAVQDAVDEYLTEHPALTGMFTNAAKSALIALLEKVAYIDGNGQQYLDELITNLAATVTSIDAVFTQGSAIIYDTDSLEALEQYLVVTASYSDGTSSVVSGYTLSGTLTVGTSTITVTYGGQTDTFTVSVTKAPLWVFTDGYTVVKSTSGASSGYTYRQATSARACGHDPIPNNNYVFTVTDNTKYELAAYGVTSLTQHSLPNSPTSVDHYGYPNSSKTPSWTSSDSTTAAYVWLALKKIDGTAFTEAELANGASAVFTWTESS